MTIALLLFAALTALVATDGATSRDDR